MHSELDVGDKITYKPLGAPGEKYHREAVVLEKIIIATSPHQVLFKYKVNDEHGNTVWVFPFQVMETEERHRIKSDAEYDDIWQEKREVFDDF